ncbi:hypothetical protein BO71DRAFT_427391 [Aspergillus ellipticus CBS 707.79]|uniref:Ankyrin n=1 Tax=Aspergillus ellipticus CBS 707.79 TaxID=1448320 RepID=A0A319DK04_9EURO|nr:hypothetical protein BO71DRAFT_427391 [Aspergillus ellipticus CBS 707.79]
MHSSRLQFAPAQWRQVSFSPVHSRKCTADIRDHIPLGMDRIMHRSSDVDETLLRELHSIQAPITRIDFRIEAITPHTTNLSKREGQKPPGNGFCGIGPFGNGKIEAKANVNMPLLVGQGSALATAAYLGRKDIVKFLISEGALVNLLLQDGSSANALEAAEEELHTVKWWESFLDTEEQKKEVAEVLRSLSPV